MLTKPKITGATVAYQLRPHKAIERNLFIALLKKLDRVKDVDISKYRYVGFGAAFLEDFKALHSEFGIKKMDCIEMDKQAYSRQQFNNPYNFIKLYNLTSTDYITGVNFKQDLNQIIWWDFASPKNLKQALEDIQLTSEKTNRFDILKFTFNAEIKSFISAYGKGKGFGDPYRAVKHKEILTFLEMDTFFKSYIPDGLNADNIKNDFSAVIRGLCIRAIKRGLSKSDRGLDFLPLCSFDYADGQLMTTITGIGCKKDDFNRIYNEGGFKNWDFYNNDPHSELIPACNIKVPVMTISERAEIDRKIHKIKDPKKLAEKLQFQYGTSIDEHIEFIKGYYKYYRFLPYYSKVIF